GGATIPVGGSPLGVAVSPAGSFVYVANMDDNTVSVYSVATDSIAATITVGLGPYGVATDPTGAFVFVGNDTSWTVSVTSAATNPVVNTVRVGTEPAVYRAVLAG